MKITVLLEFLRKELKTKELYYVTDYGWYYSTNIKFLGSFNECLDFLKMNKTQYEKQLQNFNRNKEGFWYSEILPFDELLKYCIKEIDNINSKNMDLEICIRDITHLIKNIQK